MQGQNWPFCPKCQRGLPGEKTGVRWAPARRRGQAVPAAHAALAHRGFCGVPADPERRGAAAHRWVGETVSVHPSPACPPAPPAALHACADHPGSRPGSALTAPSRPLSVPSFLHLQAGGGRLPCPCPRAVTKLRRSRREGPGWGPHSCRGGGGAVASVSICRPATVRAAPGAGEAPLGAGKAQLLPGGSGRVEKGSGQEGRARQRGRRFKDTAEKNPTKSRELSGHRAGLAGDRCDGQSWRETWNRKERMPDRWVQTFVRIWTRGATAGFRQESRGLESASLNNGGSPGGQPGGGVIEGACEPRERGSSGRKGRRSGRLWTSREARWSGLESRHVLPG